MNSTFPRPSDFRSHENTLAVIMAGGNGNRLGQLTRWHAKPALPFGGNYRNIDFALSNCVNSGLRQIGLLTQYKAHSLIQHICQGWNIFRPEIGEFIELWPAQQRNTKDWYAGTADAVFQNWDIISSHQPEHVLILAGDHIYTMDYRLMIEQHVRADADVTIGAVEVPIGEASEYGILSVDRDGFVTSFSEKPDKPKPLVSDSSAALASMGIYVFNARVLGERLGLDALNTASRHDFGRDILPAMLENSRVSAFVFQDAGTEQPRYWRDVGTVDGYWQANMDLLDPYSSIDLHDPNWPIRTSCIDHAPTRIARSASVNDSIIASACSIEGEVQRSVLHTGARVKQGAFVRDTLVLPDTVIGRNCRIERAIIDSGCKIPDGTVIGVNRSNADSNFYVSPRGVTLCTSDEFDEALARSNQDSGEVVRHVA